MFVGMNAPIPPEFEAYARDQVAAGVVASEAEAVADVLLGYLKHVEEVRALVDPALAEIERGEVIDGDVFMRELIAETRAAHGG